MRATRSGESALLLLDVIHSLSDQNIDYAPDPLSIMSWSGGLQNGSAQMHFSLRSGS